MSPSDAIAFAHAWAAAWNRRDVEAVLGHFHDEALFTSPIAQRMGFAEDGIVHGKAALRAYWLAALDRNPGLHFDVTAVYQGVDVLVLAYMNQHGASRTEVLRFAGGLIVEGHGTVAA